MKKRSEHFRLAIPFDFWQNTENYSRYFIWTLGDILEDILNKKIVGKHSPLLKVRLRCLKAGFNQLLSL